jgi:hypothetical protein
MFNFIRKLFGGLDRSEAAAERVALAVEGLAEDLEGLRARVRQRLGLDAPAGPAAPEAPEAVAELPAVEAHANGRARKRLAVQ